LYSRVYESTVFLKCVFYAVMIDIVCAEPVLLITSVILRYYSLLLAMNKSLLTQNLLLKHEAGELLYQKGLFNILQSFGTPHVSGSYALDLMTWRDLDIYLETDNMTEENFFVLGCQVCSAFAPVKMSYRNERLAKTKDLPTGLYWGVYLGNERAGAWKIDIWAVNPEECRRLVTHCTVIRQKLTPVAAQQILNIKSQCWQDPAYRRSYSSSDIYNAVLENKVTDITGFKSYLKAF
jgi:hypothetical protein